MLNRNLSKYSIILTLALTASAHAQTNETTVISFSEAVRYDAQAYSKDYNVSETEALARMLLMHGTKDSLSQILNDSEGNANGIYFTHTPKFELVIALPENAGELPPSNSIALPSTLLERLQIGVLGGINLNSLNSSLPVTFIRRGTSSTDNIREMIAVNKETIFNDYSDVQAIGYSEIDGAIEIAMHPVLSGSAQTAISNLFTVPVQFEASGSDFQRHAIRGGVNLNLPGSSQFDCTAGFPATDSSNNAGLVTAGHCDNVYDFDDPFGPTFTVSVPNSTKEKVDADADIQFMSNSSQTIEGTFVYDKAVPNSVRALENKVSVGNTGGTPTVAGTYVCHNGANSGYSCGNVYDRYWNMNNSCGQTGTGFCNNTYVQVKGSNLNCAPGDSGGPWYYGQSAYGVHVGGFNGCSTAAYTSTDWIASLNVSLAYYNF